MSQTGGRFNFDDGGVYCGAWEEGKAHGQGICTGPKGQGEYAGSWNHGFEVLGVYTWPSGNTYEGNWSMGKRHNLGVEVKGKWEYKGEWTHGYKGKYGVRNNLTSRAKYEGAWANGLQDGCGTETYDDGGTYQGQWTGGMRHGYGVRQSVTYGMASTTRRPWMTSMNSLRSEISNGNFSTNDVGMSMENCDSGNETRAGFVLSRRPAVAPYLPAPAKRNRLFRSSSSTFGKSLMGGLKNRAKSNMSIASGTSNKSCQSIMTTDSVASATSHYNFVYDRHDTGSRLDRTQDEIDPNTTETYYGEWKSDARTGYGVCKQSDGLTYEGEWLQNQRHGYGVTTFPDGTIEEGKYKFNAISSGTKKKSFAFKPNKSIVKVANAVEQARKAKDIALQKSEIAISRAAHSVAKANLADAIAQNAREEAHIARCVARDQDPQFEQPGLEYIKLRGGNYPRNTNFNDSYLAESESRDVQGPESYIQFSQQGSLVPVNNATGRADKSATTSILKAPINREISNGRSSVAESSENSGKPVSAHHHSTRPDPKERSLTHLSPNYPVVKTPSVGSISKKEIIGSKSSLANPLTPRHKKSFFRSFRIRGKKHLSLDTEFDGSISGLNTSEKTSEEAHGASQSKLLRDNENTARERRKAFEKSYSSGNHLNVSINRSTDMGSFDYKSNQEIYLANYESEMREHDQEKSLNQEVLIPSSYNQNQLIKPTNQEKVASYVTVEQKNERGEKNFSHRKPLNYPAKQSFWSNKKTSDCRNLTKPPEIAQWHTAENGQNATIIAFQSDSSGRFSPSMKQSSGSGLPAPPPISNVLETTSETRRALPEANAKINSLNFETDRVLEKHSYGNDFNMSLSNFSDGDFSPLPNKLRRRAPSLREISSDHDSFRETSAGDATRFVMMILVFLLVAGFMAIFLQFLT